MPDTGTHGDEQFDDYRFHGDLSAANELESATAYDAVFGATADNRPVWIAVRVPDKDDD